jgi:hypothetical protein
VPQYTIADSLSTDNRLAVHASPVKTALVTALAALWRHSPALGMALGALVRAYWPGFREA